MEFFDSHAHYTDEKFENDRDEIIEQIYKEGVTKFVSAGYSTKSSEMAIELANKYSYVYTICGISPNDIPENVEKLKEEIAKIDEILAKRNNKVVAVGEIGLDYYWNQENKELQKEAFIKQIELANKYELPIVIHTRDAFYDTIDILKNNTVNKKGIFHCCPLNQELVKKALELGFYISFAGPCTFKNSKNADEIIKMVPLDKMLIETDSPYLSPEPKRGTRNDSRNVKLVAEKIANVRGLNLEDIAKITYDNAMRIFCVIGDLR